MKKIFVLLFPALLLQAASYADEPVVFEVAQPLTLELAISKVAVSHPTLSVAEAEILATGAEALQAGLRLNPVFGIEVENVAGSGNYSGTDSAEYTFAVSQTFELGGKRAKRKEAALLGEKVAEWELDGRRRAVELITIRAFYTTLATESRLKLSARLVEMAQSVVEKAEQRVAAGRANKLEVTKAQIELADAELEQQNMAVALEAAKTMLASLWGGSVAEVGPLEGNLEEIHPPIPVEDLTGRLARHPEVLRAEAQIRQRQAVVKLENAQRIPDIDLGAGVRFLNETDDQALVFGLSVPLAFGNRNQGNREAARIRTMQAQDQLTVVQLGLYQELLDKSREVQAAYALVSSLKSRQLPTAQQAFEQATDGYEKGLFGSLDLLDAMRGLFHQETRYVGALLEYHQARAELDTLIAPSAGAEFKEQP
jgi:cobalt-zinc-cadmium efflux system outer membrane protein